MQSLAVLFILLSNFLSPQVAQASPPPSLFTNAIIQSDNISTSSVEWLSDEIWKYANEYDQDPYTAMDIINCESGFRSNATSTTDDTGYFQINKIHTQEMYNMKMDIHNPDDNIHFGFYLMSKEGLSPWNSSKSCWSLHPVSGGLKSP